MMRKLYRLWFCLLIISGILALGFLGVAVESVWKYISLNQVTPAKILSLQVKQVSSARFVIEVAYSYEVESNVHEGKTVFEKPFFLNRFAAETHIPVLANKLKKAWYMKRNPALSSMQNAFPQKKCFHALITLSVFIYFYFARSQLVKFFNWGSQLHTQTTAKVGF